MLGREGFTHEPRDMYSIMYPTSRRSYRIHTDYFLKLYIEGALFIGQDPVQSRRHNENLVKQARGYSAMRSMVIQGTVRFSIMQYINTSAQHARARSRMAEKDRRWPMRYDYICARASTTYDACMQRHINMHRWLIGDSCAMLLLLRAVRTLLLLYLVLRLSYTGRLVLSAARRLCTAATRLESSFSFRHIPFYLWKWRVLSLA